MNLYFCPNPMPMLTKHPFSDAESPLEPFADVKVPLGVFRNVIKPPLSGPTTTTRSLGSHYTNKNLMNIYEKSLTVRNFRYQGSYGWDETASLTTGPGHGVLR